MRLRGPAVTMRELHLFAGIGGGILAGKLLGHRCVGAVEINAYCRQVLEARQREGILESFPIHEDVCTFDGKPWRGKVDVVCGGFPCTPWSTAGKRLGTADPRHLWPEMARIIAEVRPAYVFAENVSLAAFEQPWRDLRGMGYRVPPALELSPADLGGSQSRDRWWLLASRGDDESKRLVAQYAAASGACEDALSGWEAVTWWGSGCISPPLDGPADRMGGSRAVGNAQVPAVAAAAFRILLEREMSSR